MRPITWYAVLMVAYISGLKIYATEVDSFTSRDKTLSDSTEQVNLMVKGSFENALEIANQKKSCDRKVIENALIKQFKKAFWSKMENEIFENDKIQKRNVAFADSIYRDFSIFEAPALHVAELGPIIRVNNLYVGTDKVGHLLQTGYEMFKYHHEDGMPLSEVLDWSEWTERTYYGLMTTGVYSYGDLAANYDGIYFWERVTNVLLPQGEVPYFQCQNEKWSQVAAFDINDYASVAWDEANNCSAYKTPEMHAKVEKRILDLERQTGQKLQCPVEPSSCGEMIARYGNVAPHVITPLCFH